MKTLIRLAFGVLAAACLFLCVQTAQAYAYSTLGRPVISTSYYITSLPSYGVPAHSVDADSYIVLKNTNAPGTDMWYTLDGSDPIDQSTGVLSAQAQLYASPGIPVPAGATVVKAVCVQGVVARTAAEYSTPASAYVRTDNVWQSACSPFLLDNPMLLAPSTVADAAGDWHVADYSSLPASMSAGARSLPSCLVSAPNASGAVLAVQGGTTFDNGASAPALSGSQTIAISVWRDATYDADAYVRPYYFNETRVRKDPDISIPLATGAGEQAGWYDYYINTAASAGTCVQCGMETNSRTPVYVDDLLCVSARCAPPSFISSSTLFTASTTLSIIAGGLSQGGSGSPETLLATTAAGQTHVTAPAASQYAAVDTSRPIGAAASMNYFAYSRQALESGAVCSSALSRISTTKESCELVVISAPGPAYASTVPFGTPATMTCATPGAVIWYTVDGSDPRNSPTRQKYTSAVTIRQGVDMKAVALADGLEPSWVVSRSFQVQRGPSVVPGDNASNSGFVRAGSSVSLALSPRYDGDTELPTDGYAIYYSTDGTTPAVAADGTKTGTRYTGPIRVDSNISIVAVALSDNGAPGDAETFSWQVSTAADVYEPNDASAAASNVSFPFDITATLDVPADVDFYRFTVPASGTYNFTLTCPVDHSYALSLLNGAGQIAESHSETPAIIRNLEAGTYLLCVQGDESSTAETYSLLATRTLSQPDLVNQLDFSESSMASHMLGSHTDQAFIEPKGINDGGTVKQAIAYLSRWDGPVDEAVEPYGDPLVNWVTKKVDESATQFPLFNRTVHPEQYHVQQAIMYSNDVKKQQKIAAVKSAVMSYGAVSISLDVSNISGAYYWEKKVPATPALHAVAVVGWDDTIPASSFVDALTRESPAEDGGFIIKNSWGTHRGEQGFYYVSYDSANLFANDSAIYMLESNSDYNVLYQHDPYGNTGMLNIAQSASGYQKSTFTATSAQTIEAVSFYTLRMFMDYDVYVQVGDGPLQHVASGGKENPGYYVVRTGSQVQVAAGQTFSVVVRLANRDGQSPLGVAIMQPNRVTSPNSALYVSPGQSFVSQDGVSWVDIGSSMYASCCVKALCRDAASTTSAVVTPKEGTIPDWTYIDEGGNTGGLGWSIQSFDQLEAGADTVAAQASGQPATGAVLVDEPNSAAENPSGDAVAYDLPAKFDLRDMDGNGTAGITPVRNQGEVGTCWTFATMASAESVLMRRGMFAYTYPATVSAGADRVVHLTDENPQANVALRADISVPQGSASPVASDYIVWSFNGNLTDASIVSRSSLSGEEKSLLRVSQAGTITATAVSAADTLKSASMTITVVDDRVKPADAASGAATEDAQSWGTADTSDRLPAAAALAAWALACGCVAASAARAVRAKR